MELHRAKKKNLILGSLMVLLLAACSGNFFESSADTESDNALLFDAQMAINEKNYSQAITVIEGMSATAQTERNVRLMKATAYGGLCGFEFLTLLDAIANQGSQRFFVTLMKAMSGATAAKQAHCESAIDEVRLISTSASSRTSDENIFMAVAAMAEIGTILNKTVDADNDGTTDSYNHCTAFSTSDLSRLVASMAETATSISALSGSSVASADLSDLTTACDSLAGQTPPLDFCSQTDPSSVSSDEQQGMKGVLGSDQSIGLGGSNNGDCGAGASVTTCATATGC